MENKNSYELRIYCFICLLIIIVNSQECLSRVDKQGSWFPSIHSSIYSFLFSFHLPYPFIHPVSTEYLSPKQCCSNGRFKDEQDSLSRSSWPDTDEDWCAVKYFGQGNRISRWQNWDLNLGLKFHYFLCMWVTSKRHC